MQVHGSAADSARHRLIGTDSGRHVRRDAPPGELRAAHDEAGGDADQLRWPMQALPALMPPLVSLGAVRGGRGG
jgi:hypothetical protein